ncbi:MAG TPA: chromate resistance protein ChrB domain-containing protein, partial [Terriglobales bacterium]|nr:chromate resistance protein ChrB domain-containing protein [Terriglobales bacterium]
DYAIKEPTLQRLALIVRGADIKGQEQIAAESLGLRAIAHGFAQTGMSDQERLKQEFPIYDALYQYLRRQQ